MSILWVTTIRSQKVTEVSFECPTRLLHRYMPSPPPLFLPSLIQSIDRKTDRPSNAAALDVSHVHLHCGQFLLSRSLPPSHPAVRCAVIRRNHEKTTLAAATQIYATRTTYAADEGARSQTATGKGRGYGNCAMRVGCGRHFISKATSSDAHVTRIEAGSMYPCLSLEVVCFL